jgi:hypothetical protein
VVTRLVIPEHHRATICAIARAPQNTIDALAEALERSSKDHIQRETLISWVADALGENEDIDLLSVVDVLLTMSSARIVHPRSAADFASDVSTASDLQLDAVDRQALHERLTRLLSLENVVTTSKVVDLADEHERIFHSARIVTDIRPVFADDPKQPPDGVITFHLLKLQSFASGRVEDVSIAMDDNDLAELRFAVERASDKAITLGKYLDGIGLHRYATEESS